MHKKSMFARPLTTLVLVAALLEHAPSIAQTLDENALVYIECYNGSGSRVSSGSGVIVRADGRVLTAKHVIRPASTCRASIGTGATIPTRNLVRGRASSAYDAIIVRLVPSAGESFTFVRYVELKPIHKNLEIEAYGVPFDGTGQVSIRRGALATSVPSGDGSVETTALTARGMSGGPVVLRNQGGLVGIVIGVNLDVTTGLPTNFGVLAAQEVATELDLLPFTDVLTESRAQQDKISAVTPLLGTWRLISGNASSCGILSGVPGPDKMRLSMSNSELVWERFRGTYWSLNCKVVPVPVPDRGRVGFAPGCPNNPQFALLSGIKLQVFMGETATCELVKERDLVPQILGSLQVAPYLGTWTLVSGNASYCHIMSGVPGPDKIRLSTNGSALLYERLEGYEWGAVIEATPVSDPGERLGFLGDHPFNPQFSISSDGILKMYVDGASACELIK